MNAQLQEAIEIMQPVQGVMELKCMIAKLNDGTFRLVAEPEVQTDRGRKGMVLPGGFEKLLEYLNEAFSGPVMLTQEQLEATVQFGKQRICNEYMSSVLRETFGETVAKAVMDDPEIQESMIQALAGKAGEV